MKSLVDKLSRLVGETVVLDCVSPYLAVGRLIEAAESYVELADADMHDLRDTNTNRELYLVKTARLGVQPNRKALLFRMAEIVAVSRLTDVVTE